MRSRPTSASGERAAIRRFSTLLDAYPIAFRGNRLHLLFVPDARPIWSAEKYLRALQSRELTDEGREYLIAKYDSWPFPHLDFRGRPDPGEVSKCLFTNFTAAQEVLFTQRQVGSWLLDAALAGEYEIVAMMTVDGLSYYDLPDDGTADPCLVEGVSITEFGYRQVISRPKVSQRFFAAGYRDQIGFTYFDPQSNSLASDLYEPFGASQVHTVATFDEIVDILENSRLSHTYVQISAPGLDELCDGHHDRPPREAYLNQVLTRFQRLFDCLELGGRRVLACLTADHGIIWREHLEPQAVLDELPADDSHHPRYIPGSVRLPHARTLTHQGRGYSLLEYPYLTRHLRKTEWGVHGGLSAWESLVPFMVKKTV